MPKLTGRAIFADKAYCDIPFSKKLYQDQDTYIYTPVKLVKGQTENQRQFKKAADDLFSTAVSRVRQPIESLSNRVGGPMDK